MAKKKATPTLPRASKLYLFKDGDGDWTISPIQPSVSVRFDYAKQILTPGERVTSPCSANVCDDGVVKAFGIRPTLTEGEVIEFTITPVRRINVKLDTKAAIQQITENSLKGLK